MYVVTENAERTTTTPAARVAGLAAPSQGSAELSSWRVYLDAGSVGPVHAVDREQIWMPVAGSIDVTVGGRTTTVGAGQAVVLAAGEIRQVSVAGAAAEALVCMAAGGQATMPGSDTAHPLPWAL